MADTLQKVFLVFTRPFYETTAAGQTYKVPYKGAINTADSKPLKTNNVGAVSTSPDKLNCNGNFTSDPWFLHSSYTSYDEMRLALKSLITIYGTENIKCTIYVPIDYQVLPIE
jgi:hypothetical protein